MEQESNAYILGTETEELHRLGFQHQVWSSEARNGWEAAGFKYGDTLLDLGCGPGFCTFELAYMVGNTGKVIATDMSQQYLNHLNALNKNQKLNIETILSEFENLELEPNSLDGIYHRWALAWTPHVEKIVQKLYTYLKPGGKIVSHEYYDWSTFQFEPNSEGLSIAIKAALRGWEEMNSNINIGRKLPEIFRATDFKLESQRIMAKLATPKDLTWHWPKTFFKIYLPKLHERGFLSLSELELALSEFDEIELKEGATLFCPSLIEVIASK